MRSIIFLLGVGIVHVQAKSTTSTTTISAPASSATSSSSSSYTNDAQFQKDTLAAHNFYRGEHNASALVWNSSIAKTGSSWSQGCEFVHSRGPTGENLAAGYPNATSSIDAWGLERESYSWKSPGFSENTGHFTQLVWKSTTSVGCGRTNCNGKGGTPGWYVVCEYFPAGNVVSASGDKNQFFETNVDKLVEGNLKDTVESGVSSEGVSVRGLGREVVVLGMMAVVVGLVVL